MNLRFAQAATSLPPADSIRETAREVVARPEFQIDAPSQLPFDLLRLIGRILKAIIGPFQRFAESVFAFSPVLGWLMIMGMLLIVIGLVAHIVYSFRVALARRVEAISGLSKSRRLVDPAKLEVEAKLAAARGDFIGAVRLVFRACLARLEAAEERALRLGLTNRELLRRYQSTPLVDALRTFVETIDAKWYGHALCDAGDYEACLQAQRVVNRHVGEIAARAREKSQILNTKSQTNPKFK